MKFIKWLMMCMAAVSMLMSCEDMKQDTPEAPKIMVNPESSNFTAGGGSVVLALFANADWSVSDVPQWLTVSPMSGGESIIRQDITIKAEANTGGAREATLVFAMDGASCEVKIKQEHSYGSEVPDEILFYEPFKSSIGDFTIKDVKVPEQLGFVWEHSAQYTCMKATAYETSTTKNYESESWLISPEIDLTSVADATLTFEHAGGYFGTATEEATLWVSKEEGKWDQLIIEKGNYPTSWNFISAGTWSLKSYAGSKIKIAFKYSSTATKAGTWEVRNVKIIPGSVEDFVIPQVDPTKVNWMELPSRDNENLTYISHRFELDKKIHRNYTIGWSQADLVSLWIAYPLNKTYTQNKVERTDEWAYDPVLGKDLSSAPFSGYAGDYARGHQLPSADRLCNYTANAQTFYGTNIAPQLNEHNEGIWSDLEIHIRTVANASDTTYVVTGCLVEGATETSTDSDGKKITIPVAYYKALLYYKKGATPEWSCAGFYTEHKNYTDRSLKKISMSIDELENKTGFDFFVHLADKIGKDKADALEAQNPADEAVWNL